MSRSTQSARLRSVVAAAALVLTVGSAAAQDTNLLVGVWSPEGEKLVEASVTATDLDSQGVKAVPGPGNGHLISATLTPTPFGNKTELNIIDAEWGLAQCGLMLLPVDQARIDVVYTGKDQFEVFSPHIVPSAPPAGDGAPANDLCENAIGVEVGSSTAGNTAGATPDLSFPTCVTVNTAPGVWYSVTGTGNTMTATTCPNSSYDTKVSVYCGDCDTPTCITGNDDNCALSGLLSSASWCSQAGATYNILVHGFNDDAGAFTLDVTDDGVPCGGATACLAVGACCNDDGSCTQTTEGDCAASGGSYQGDDTECSTSSGEASVYGAAPNTAIPDFNPAGLSSTITVPDSMEIGDVDLGLVVTHTWTGDLIVTLEHGGTTVEVINRPGEPVLGTFGCPEDNWDVVLDDEGAGGAMEDQCVPNLTSPPSYTPNNLLGAFDGMDAAGDWTLTISDNAELDFGTLNSWELSITGGESVCEQPECFLVIGDDDGSSTFAGADHVFMTQVDNVDEYYAVLMESIPDFVLPQGFARGAGTLASSGMAGGSAGLYSGVPSWMTDGEFAVQILMWNPGVFPELPEQFSVGLKVKLGANGKVTSEPYGEGLGTIELWHEVGVNAEGQAVLRFPFSVDMP